MSALVYSLNLAAQLLISVFVFNCAVKPRKSLPVTFLVWFIPYDIIHVLCNYSTVHVPGAVQSLLDVSVIFAVIMLMYDKSKILKKVIIVLLYFVFQALTEILALSVVSMIFDIKTSDFYEYGDKNIYVSCGRVMYADLMMLVAVLISVMLKRKELKSEKKYPDFIMMTGFTSVHLFFLCLYYRFNRENINEINNIIQIVFQTLLFFIIFVQYGYAVKIRKYAAAELEYISLKNEMDLTYNYYSTAEKKYSEISEIRHDFLNQLAAVKKLIELSEGKNEARNIIEDLQHNLEKSKMISFCSNRTLNAVLNAKISEEKYSETSYDIILEDTDKLPFTEYEICSLFSNLFDNAAEACALCKHEENKYIKIRCKVSGPFCIIKFTNGWEGNEPDLESNKKEPGHGYGLKIIDKICKKYKCEFSLNCENSRITAVVAVPLNTV